MQHRKASSYDCESGARAWRRSTAYPPTSSSTTALCGYCQSRRSPRRTRPDLGRRRHEAGALRSRGAGARRGRGRMNRSADSSARSGSCGATVTPRRPAFSIASLTRPSALACSTKRATYRARAGVAPLGHASADWFDDDAAVEHLDPGSFADSANSVLLVPAMTSALPAANIRRVQGAVDANQLRMLQFLAQEDVGTRALQHADPDASAVDLRRRVDRHSGANQVALLDLHHRRGKIDDRGGAFCIDA